MADTRQCQLRVAKSLLDTYILKIYNTKICTPIVSADPGFQVWRAYTGGPGDGNPFHTGPADATATPSSLASLKPRMI